MSITVERMNQIIDKYGGWDSRLQYGEILQASDDAWAMGRISEGMQLDEFITDPYNIVGDTDSWEGLDSWEVGDIDQQISWDDVITDTEFEMSRMETGGSVTIDNSIDGGYYEDEVTIDDDGIGYDDDMDTHDTGALDGIG